MADMKLSIQNFSELTYTSFELAPTFTVLADETEISDADYSASYAVKIGDTTASLGENGKPVTAGFYVVTVTGLGDYASYESAQHEFEVQKADIQTSTISLLPTSYVYENGGPFEPLPTVSIGKNSGKYVLISDTDYTYSYADNTDVGTARVIISAAGDNFTGEPKEKTFKINNAEVKIGDSYYATFSAGMSALKGQSGATLTVLKEMSLAGVFNRFTLDETYDCTIDFGGFIHKMNAAYFTLNGGKLTVTNGTLNAIGNNAGEFIVNSGELTVTDSMTINGSGSITPICVFGECVVNTEGTLTSVDSFCISGNGTAGKGGYVVNVNGGSVTSAYAPAIYHPNDGIININGGTITGTTAIYQKSGQLNIKGGELVATGEKKDYQYDGSGANATGDTIVIDNCGYPGGEPKPEITGGEFKSANADAVGTYSYGTDPETQHDREPVDGFVKGGKYDAPLPEDCIADGYEIDDSGEVVPDEPPVPPVPPTPTPEVKSSVSFKKIMVYTLPSRKSRCYERVGIFNTGNEVTDSVTGEVFISVRTLRPGMGGYSYGYVLKSALE